MKVVIAINTSWNIYNFRKGLIKGLQKDGHEVIAVSPKDDYSTLVESLGCKHFPIHMENKGTNPLKDWKLYKELKKVYKEIDPDVILQYTIKPNIYGTLAAKKLGIPVINNVSGLGTIFLHNNPVYKVAQRLYKIAFKYPKKVFFQNNDDRQLFLEKNLIDKNITDLLPGSGVNIEELNYQQVKEEEPFTFLVLARVLYDKGIMEYANAAKLLKAKGYTFKAQLGGALDTVSKMGVPENRIKEFQDQNIIEYLGEITNVPEAIRKCQCVVLPSYREGTPKSLLEAGAIGRPIIATNVPGCKEVVINEQNGYLCAAKDQNALASVMEKMLNHSEKELIQFGENSRKLIEDKFDEKLVIDKYLKAIKE